VQAGDDDDDENDDDDDDDDDFHDFLSLSCSLCSAIGAGLTISDSIWFCRTYSRDQSVVYHLTTQ